MGTYKYLGPINRREEVFTGLLSERKETSQTAHWLYRGKSTGLWSSYLGHVPVDTISLKLVPLLDQKSEACAIFGVDLERSTLIIEVEVYSPDKRIKYSSLTKVYN